MTSAATLYHAPGACSTVTHVALESCAMDYELCIVDLADADRRAPSFPLINPAGKVPVLAAEGAVYLENPAILHALSVAHPGSQLKPAAVNDAEFLRDLVWCGATLHPMVRQIRAPHRFTDGDTTGVRAHGLKQFGPIAAMLDRRLENGWWYSGAWSIIDTYLRWITTIANSHFDLADLPGLRGHVARDIARPASLRAARREADAIARSPP